MPIDCREKLFRDIEQIIVEHTSVDLLNSISYEILNIINNYEVLDRCTDIVPCDSMNEKLLKRYVACLRVDGKSEKTIYQYQRTIQRFSSFINKSFTEVGIYDVRMFLGFEQERGISNRSAENLRANLSAFFQWLTADDIINKNPIANLKSIKYVDEIKKPFSDVEIDKIRSSAKSFKERALIEFLLATGVRVSELSSMKVNDVNLLDYSVHVKNGKGGKERMTYITPVAASHLEKYLSSRKNNGEALFYNQKGGVLCPGGIRHILRELSKRSGVKGIHPHRFRRSFATSAVRKGLEIQEVQRLLGHSNINTTMQYVCTDDEAIKASYKRYIA